MYICDWIQKNTVYSTWLIGPGPFPAISNSEHLGSPKYPDADLQSGPLIRWSRLARVSTHLSRRVHLVILHHPTIPFPNEQQ